MGPIDRCGSPYPTLSRVLHRQAPLLRAATARQVAALIAQSDPRFAVADGARLRLQASLVPSVRALRALRNRAVVRQLTGDLVGLSRRPDATFEIFAHGRPVVCRQRFGHVEKQPGRPHRLVAGRTLSSEAAKNEDDRCAAYLRYYNANLAAVHLDDALLLVRSGRSDTVAKVEELLLFGAMQRQGRTGGEVEPSWAALISALDRSWIKSLTARLTGLLEDERAYLGRQHAAVDALFGSHRQLAYPVAGDRSVRIRRPLLLGLPFSAQARNILCIYFARRANRPAGLALFDALAFQARDTPWGQAMAACRAPHAKRAWLRHLAREHRWEALPRADVTSLHALSLLCIGRDLAGRRYLRPADPGYELILLHGLLGRCGVIPHVQCKSGLDRALTMTATLTASALYGRLRGEPLDPATVRRHAGDMSLLRWLFTRAADRLGADPIRQVRGVGAGAKWGMRGPGRAGHPVPAALYLPYDSAIGQRGQRDTFFNPGERRRWRRRWHP
jgi:hypothetical protein